MSKDRSTRKRVMRGASPPPKIPIPLPLLFNVIVVVASSFSTMASIIHQPIHVRNMDRKHTGSLMFGLQPIPLPLHADITNRCREATVYAISAVRNIIGRTAMS